MTSELDHFQATDHAHAAATLADRGVDVWLVHLCDASLMVPALSLLSNAEKERCRSFRFDRDRLRYVLAHAALRHILGAYTALPATHLPFDIAAGRKPVLNLVPTLHFNLSHTQDRALVAVSRLAEVGIDIVRCRTIADMPGLAWQFLSARELEKAWRYRFRCEIGHC